MGLTWVTDYVAGTRSDSSRAFQAELLQATETPDATYQRLAQECQADAECWKNFGKAEPELAGKLNVSDPTPAGTVEANPTVFNVYIRQSVQPDRTLRVDIDQLKQSLATDVATMQETVTNGFGEVKSALGDINATLGDLRTGQARF